MCGFCNVWVCAYVGFVMCGFCNVLVCVCGFCNVWVCGFCNVWVGGCFGNQCTCIYRVLYCLYCVFVLFRLCIFLFVLSVLVYGLLPPSDNSIAVSSSSSSSSSMFPDRIFNFLPCTSNLCGLGAYYEVHKYTG